MKCKTKLLLVISLAGSGLLAPAPAADKELPRQPEQSFAGFPPDKPPMTMGDFGMQLIFNSIDSPIGRIKSKMQLVKKAAPAWKRSGGDDARLQALMEQVSKSGSKRHFVEAEKTLD